MGKETNIAPPGFVLAFFRWFSDPAHAEDIEGDLTESFYRNLEKYSQRKANYLLMWEVALLLRPSLMRNPLADNPFNLSHMKKSDWMWMAIIHALMVVLMVSPFLPGPSNKLVIGLSALAQSTAFLGVALVPVGLLWLFLDSRQSLKNPNAGAHRYWLALIAGGIATVPCLLSLIYTYLLLGTAAGLVASVLLGAGFYKLWIGIQMLRAQSTSYRIVPVYLLTVPALAFMMFLYVIGPVSAYSRGLAMDRGEALIALIEQYKLENGRYPASLHDLERGLSTEIPGSPVMGISGWKYSVDQQGFNVSFSQWQHMAVDEEIVLFSKSSLADSEPLSFDYKLDKYRIKGAYASFDAKREHWRYYWCD